MKVPNNKNENYINTSYHHWVTALFTLLGFGILAVAAFWIRKCKSSSIAKHEYSALQRTESGSERLRLETQIYDEAYAACRHFLAKNERYELRSQLGSIGPRSDKRWYMVQDITLGAERLLSLVNLPSKCPIKPSETARETVLSLFRGLQHPYIHPVLDIEFWDSQAALITPLNNAGSLRDLIYSCPWNEEWERKYVERGEGLPLWQIQRLGRQILEALLFLRDRSFPPFYHLHSGNVILQNGVARLAGLENPLLGLPPRSTCNLADTLSFGHLLFEMTTGYESLTPPSPAHLQLELERVPRVAEVLRFIFEDDEHPPSIEELLCCDLFRGVELRELRGIKVTQSRFSTDVLELLDVVRESIVPSTNKRNIGRIVEDRQLEDILEEESEENDAEYSIKISR